MPTHEIATHEDWDEARKRLREREEELGRLDEEIATQRQELPWVRVEKEYTLDTENGKQTLPELFDGRSQLLIYQLMFGPTYEQACPGCTALADGFDGALTHLNARDVTLIAISRAPIEKLSAYKRRMGWKFPYVSSYSSDFNFDFQGSLTDEQMASPEMTKMVEEADDWLKGWADNVGTDLEHGMAENPSWNVFKLEDSVVYRTYYRTAPDRFMLSAYYHLMLDQVPAGRAGDFALQRRDEY
jgi:predicted dithiol-disulfide oxidoreductase (DUF899 family)